MTVPQYYEGGISEQTWDLLAKRFKFDPNAELRPLGAGQNGWAYDLGGDRVLKITGDDVEAKAAQVTKGKPTKHLVRVFDVVQIPCAGGQFRCENFFCILMEKLAPPDHVWKDLFAYGTVYFNIPIHPSDVLDEMRSYEMYKQLDVAVDKRTYKKFMKWLFDTVLEAQNFGIKIGDYNGGNIMRRGKEHVLIDVGGWRAEAPDTSIPTANLLAAAAARVNERLHIQEPSMGTFSKLLASVDRRKESKPVEHDLRQGGELWHMTDEFEFVSQHKMQALGMNDEQLREENKS